MVLKLYDGKSIYSYIICIGTPNTDTPILTSLVTETIVSCKFDNPLISTHLERSRLFYHDIPKETYFLT